MTEQEKIISKMSPEKKLNLSLQLYYSARNLKRAALKEHHPELSEDEIEKSLKRFSYMQVANLYKIFILIFNQANINNLVWEKINP